MPESFPNHQTLGKLREQIALKLTGSDTPALDALILLETVTDMSRVDLLAELRSPVATVMDEATLENLSGLVEERRRGVSIAYITGIKEFYGYEFLVGPGALVPRPESEHLVEEGLRLLDADAHAVIHDCCTGTGGVGIALARERAARGYTTKLILSDIEPAALRWAVRNAEQLLSGVAEVQYSVEHQDLLHAISQKPVTETGRYDLITANPPYLTAGEMEQIAEQGWTEPVSALDGGRDGLDLYPELAAQAFAQLRPERYVLVEHGWTQGSAVRNLFVNAGFTSVETVSDLAGRERLLRALRPADNL